MSATRDQSTDAQRGQYETVGQGDYVVQDGDCLYSIAEKTGFFWKTLWNLPENQELKSERGEAGVVHPGDRLYIPELRVKEESCATEARHRFRRKGVPSKLRIKVLSEGQPRAMEPFSVDFGVCVKDGTTDGDGIVEVPIPPKAGPRATLRVGSGDNLAVYQLALGNLNPLDSISGVQARLNSLGFDAGPVDGRFGPATRDALRRFQAAYKLEVTGEPDEATRQKLKEVYGS